MVNITIEGFQAFPCPVGWTAKDAVEEIRSAYLLIGGFISRNNEAMLSTSNILEKDDEGSIFSFEFVGFQKQQQTVQQGKRLYPSISQKHTMSLFLLPFLSIIR
jgi:hypothetical protein